LGFEIWWSRVGGKGKVGWGIEGWMVQISNFVGIYEMELSVTDWWGHKMEAKPANIMSHWRKDKGSLEKCEASPSQSESSF